MNIIKKLKYADKILKYWLTRLGFVRNGEIKKLNFEPCSVCNINCAYCNFQQKNDRQNFMEIKTFIKVLKELQYNAYETNYQLNQISLSQSGEVLLHPQFKTFVEILEAYTTGLNRIRTKHIVMNTNLMLLNRDIVDFLLDMDVFTIISCSIDGTNKQEFERLRKGANYEKCLENFEYLAMQKDIRRIRNLEIRINNGNDKQSSQYKYDEKMLDCFELADKVIKYNFHEWTGDINVEGYKESPNKGFCQFMFDTVLITTDGGVAKCCNDLNASTVYGNIKHKTLSDVYHSKERKQFLKLMYKKQREKIPGCSKCTRE